MDGVGISNAVRAVLHAFDSLLSLPLRPTDELILTAVREEKSKFRVWSGNIGAHKTGRNSLEYRLRDSSHIRKQIVDLLQDLETLLKDGASIISGKKTPWEELEDDLDDDDSASRNENSSGGSLNNESLENGDMPRTELGQIAQDTADVVDCLFRLSVTIRNPAPHDRFNATIMSDTSHFESSDIAHVRSKYITLNQELSIRLGKANSRRRQYFKYREGHHSILAQGLSVEPGLTDTRSTVASSLPLNLKEQGSERVNTTPAPLATVDEDVQSESGLSQTTFASTNTEMRYKFRFPPLPKEASKGPFECPFCFMMILGSNKVSWRRHVYGDLRPYICLFPECKAGVKEFTRRHQWAEHELQNHWKTYQCPLGCEGLFTSLSFARDHLTQEHAHTVSENQHDALLRLSSCPAIFEDGTDCPFCQEHLYSFKQYRRHVGRHQEQLALFALPCLETIKTENEDAHYIGLSTAGQTDLGLSADEMEKNLVGDQINLAELNKPVVQNKTNPDEKTSTRKVGLADQLEQLLMSSPTRNSLEQEINNKDIEGSFYQSQAQAALKNRTIRRFELDENANVNDNDDDSSMSAANRTDLGLRSEELTIDVSCLESQSQRPETIDEFDGFAQQNANKTDAQIQTIEPMQQNNISTNVENSSHESGDSEHAYNYLDSLVMNNAQSQQLPLNTNKGKGPAPDEGDGNIATEEYIPSRPGEMATEPKALSSTYQRSSTSARGSASIDASKSGDQFGRILVSEEKTGGGNNLSQPDVNHSSSRPSSVGQVQSPRKVHKNRHRPRERRDAVMTHWRCCTCQHGWFSVSWAGTARFVILSGAIAVQSALCTNPRRTSSSQLTLL